MKRRDFLFGGFVAAAGASAPNVGASTRPTPDMYAQLSTVQKTLPADVAQLPLFALQGMAQSRPRSIVSKLSDIVSVKDFGATGDGRTDDTEAVQRAIDNFAQGHGTIRFPLGTYRITSTITVARDRIALLGDGKHVSIINFEPKTESPCFAFAKGNAVLFQAQIRGFGFVGNNKVGKIAIRATDVSEFTIEDIATYPWTGGSIGIQLRGRELIQVRNVSLKADLPISIEANPNNNIALDHAHFSDCYLLPSKGEPCVRMASGLYVANVLFDGAQAWVGGSGGFYWNDTAGRSASLDLSLQNIRYEQGADPNAYTIFIRHNHALHGLTIRNVNLGAATRGIYLRGCRRVMMDTVSYHGSSREALNIDGSCDQVFLQNCMFQDGSTASMTGLTEKWSLHRFSSRTPVAGSSFWVSGKG
ncbi:MAG TPA: glycosyl hydrolase family 28-related protein [Burkholderiales bacterium]|nr:glycosyl hydrolase family 28-related protein [Burkholderiales bacterium]